MEARQKVHRIPVKHSYLRHKSASFLDTRAVKQLFEEVANDSTKHVWKDVYVDDVLTGGRTIAEVIKLRQNLTKLFEKGGMTNRKWASNSGDDHRRELTGESTNYGFRYKMVSTKGHN